jgi:hypothetical protein
MTARGITLALLAALSAITVASDAVACSPSPEARNQPPPSLDRMLSSHPIVFVGVVTNDGLTERKPGSEPDSGLRYATFRIEIPLKGVDGKDTIQVRNRGGGDCYNRFSVGERWIFAGSADGAMYSIWSGSTVLADSKGDLPEAEQSAHQKALRKALPQIGRLPPPVTGKPGAP